MQCMADTSTSNENLLRLEQARGEAPHRETEIWPTSNESLLWPRLEIALALRRRAQDTVQAHTRAGGLVPWTTRVGCK